MAKKFRYQHISSTIKDKQPEVLFDGEIAVNRYAGSEKLFIRNSANDTISFSSDSNFYNKNDVDTKLGSAFTGTNSGVTVTEYIENNEFVISNALTDLDDRKSDTGHTHGQYLTAVTAHSQASNTISAMTSYSKPSVTSAIATSDTLNGAIGKLECAFGGLKLVKISQTDYDNLTTKDSNTLYVIDD